MHISDLDGFSLGMVFLPGMYVISLANQCNLVYLEGWSWCLLIFINPFLLMSCVRFWTMHLRRYINYMTLLEMHQKMCYVMCSAFLPFLDGYVGVGRGAIYVCTKGKIISYNIGNPLKKPTKRNHKSLYVDKSYSRTYIHANV